MGFTVERANFTVEKPTFVVEKPSVSDRLFTPISKQITGKSLGERTDLLEKSAQSLTQKAVEEGRTPSTAEFFIKQLPSAVAQTGVEFADLSPFDIGLIAATSGVGRVPIGGATVGQIAQRVPVGKGFIKGAKELGKLQTKLKPFRGQVAARLTQKSVATGKAIAEATKPPGAFTSSGTEINPAPRTDLVPSMRKVIPKEGRTILDDLATKQTKILADKRGIVPIQEQKANAWKGNQIQQLYDSWKPGTTAQTEAVWGMTDDFISQLQNMGDKATVDQIDKISSNVIKASSMISENARSLGARNQVVNVAGEQLKFLITQIEKLDPEARGAARHLLNQVQTPGFWDKFMEYRTAALLTSPFTQERNILGNAIGLAYRIPESIAAGGVNAIESAITRKPREKFAREAIAETVGIFRGFRPAMKNALKALADENFVSHGRTQEAVRFNQAITGMKGKIIRLPFRALNAMDEFFSQLGISASLHKQAAKQAFKEGSKNAITRATELVNNPTPEMIKIGARESLVNTFRQPLGGSSKSVQTAINKNKVAKFLIPFFRTPVNLFKWSYRRGQTGIISKANWRAIAKGTPEQRSEAIARMALGQVIGAGLFLEAMQGNITGRLSGDKAKRDALRRQGIQPYSIKFGDKYVSYRSYEPISSIIALSANAAEIVKDKENPLNPAKATQLVAETVKMLKDQSFLRGISDMFNALDDPERFGERFIQNVSTSTIPTGVGYLARLHDPVIREPDSIPDAIKAKLPYFSKGVPEKLDIWGRVVTKEGTLAQRALMPSGVTTTKPDLLEEELMSLEKFPRKIAKKYRGLKLTNKERNVVTMVEGRIQKIYLDNLVRTPKYQGSDPQTQLEMVNTIFRQIRKDVRAGFFNNKFKTEFQKLKTEDEKIRLLENFTNKKILKR